MASFIGDYTCKADSKCRVVVPASFRRVMVASQQTFFVLRKNVFGKCIDRGTQEVEMDTNGRILLPRKMLDEIGIDKEMVLAAQDSMIQVWDARVYEEVAISGKELGAMAEEIFKN